MRRIFLEHGYELIDKFEVGLYDTLEVHHYKKNGIDIRYTPSDNTIIIHNEYYVTEVLFKGKITSEKKLNNLLEIIKDNEPETTI